MGVNRPRLTWVGGAPGQGDHNARGRPAPVAFVFPLVDTVDEVMVADVRREASAVGFEADPVQPLRQG